MATVAAPLVVWLAVGCYVALLQLQRLLVLMVCCLRLISVWTVQCEIVGDCVTAPI